MSTKKEIQKKDDNNLNISGGFMRSVKLKLAKFKCKKCRRVWDEYMDPLEFSYKCPFCGNKSGLFGRSIVYDDKIRKEEFNPIHSSKDPIPPETH